MKKLLEDLNSEKSIFEKPRLKSIFNLKIKFSLIEKVAFTPRPTML